MTLSTGDRCDKCKTLIHTGVTSRDLYRVEEDGEEKFVCEACLTIHDEVKR